MNKKDKKIISTAGVLGILTASMTTNIMAVQKTQAQVSEPKTQVTQLSSVEELKQKIAEMKKEAEAKKEALTKAESELNVAHDETVNLQGVYDKAKADALRAELETNDAIIANLEKQLALIENQNKDLAEAKEKHESLKKEVESKQGELTKAEEAVKQAEKELEEAIKNAEDASPEDIAKAQAKVEETKLALEEANKVLETAKEEVAKAQSDYDKANEDLEVAQGNVDFLVQQVIELTNKLGEAQAKYDEAKLVYDAATDPELKAQAEQELQKAKEGLEAVQKEYATAEEDLNTAKEGVATAQGNLDASKEVLAQKQQAQEVAQGELDEANGVLDTAKDDLAKAEERHQGLVEEKERLEGIVAEKQQALDKANADYDKVKGSLEEAKQKEAEAKKVMDEKEQAMAEASAKYKLGSKGFFESIGANQALEYLDPADKNPIQEEIYKYTNIGAKGDATDLENMKATIAIMKKCNEIRKSLGLSELKVTMEMIAGSQIQSNWSAGMYEESGYFGHSHAFDIGENLSGAPSDISGFDPFVGWYDNEKSIYDKACEQDPSIRDMTSAELKEKYPDLYPQVGHYLAIINPDYVYTGASFNNRYESMPTIGQTFDYLENVGDFVNTKSYTVDEYEALFMNYYNGLVNAEDIYNQAKS